MDLYWIDKKIINSWLKFTGQANMIAELERIAILRDGGYFMRTAKNENKKNKPGF